MISAMGADSGVGRDGPGADLYRGRIIKRHRRGPGTVQ